MFLRRPVFPLCGWRSRRQIVGEPFAAGLFVKIHYHDTNVRRVLCFRGNLAETPIACISLTAT
jgi:hypothetical protein